MNIYIYIYIMYAYMCFYVYKFLLCIELRPLAQPLAHISTSHGYFAHLFVLRIIILELS